MNLFNRLKLAVNQSSWDKFMSDFMSGNDVSGDSNINIKGNNALKLNAVWGCLRVIGETFASVPYNEFKKIDDKTRDKTNDTGLYDILHNQPNDEMTPFSFKEMSTYQINLGGDFVARKEYTRYGELRGLYPFEWQTVDIDREKDSPNRLRYNVSKNGSAEKQIYYRSDVLHIPGPSLNGITGMSPIQYASESIKLGMTLERVGNRAFKNGTFPSGGFEHPGELKEEAYKRLKSDLDSQWSGENNFGKPILLEDGLKFNPFKISLADMQILESRRFTTEEICRIYRVPPHLVSDLQRSTNNNIEQQSLEFIMYTMLPWFKRYEDGINCQLLTKEQRKQGYYIEANVSALLRGDQKSMAEAFASGRQWGWLSVNDIRRLLNMNPIEGGYTYLQPMNMVPVGTVPTGDNYKKILDDICSLIELKGK
jgi:HK97 family phage portal protein